ncbi:MAG TPA: RidA family protein [Deltaproteobacteria bacterium]|nr:RidA family protein [Deltaproteobacteria bacterium]
MKLVQTVQTDRAPAAIGPYSQAVVANGFVFCSGQIAMDPASGQLVEGDVAAQTRRALANLQAVLEASGSALSKVVRCTVFLRSMDDFAAMNAVYAEAFGDARPARAAVEVSRLPRDVSVEIDAIAVVG